MTVPGSCQVSIFLYGLTMGMDTLRSLAVQVNTAAGTARPTRQTPVGKNTVTEEEVITPWAKKFEQYNM